MPTFELNAELYSLGAIEAAARAFAGIADVRITRTEDSFTCTFAACAYDEAQTMAEFENYVIDAMNTHTP